MEDNVEKILNDFKEKQTLYEEYCLVMYKLIESMLQLDGYKYHIRYRIKKLDKLKDKILRKQEEGKVCEKLEDIEDLAGLRIVFYFEADKENFLKKLLKEISGDIEIEYHKKKTGYRATHVTASFGEKRIKLSEYNKFAGLKCEIQLTSILHHAWSEIEHDLIYKDILGIKNNKRKIVQTKKALQKILTKYLIKASSEFDNIVRKLKK